MKYKNIFLAACPGTASNTLKHSLENSLGIKAISFKYGGGFHQTSLRKPNLSKKFLFLLRKMFKEKNLFYQHFFPTKQNMDMLEQFIGKSTIFIVTYRNIFEIVNYIMRWNNLKKRGPLSMVFARDRRKNSYDTDLNIILVLQFFKLWFLRKKENKINIKFVSFKEITSKNKNLKSFLQKISSKRFDFLEPINLSKKKKKFKVPKFRKDLIIKFKKYNKEINFKLIGF